jgi:aminopeptidase N
MERMARWARRYDDEGPIHLGQRLGHIEKEPRIQRALVYNKGAWVLHMLRQRLGDEAFFEGARAFLETHRYEGATTGDFRAALESASGRDLGAYFERWVYGTGLPELRWTAHTEEAPDGYRTTVEVQPQNLPGPLPLEIKVRTDGDTETRQVELSPSGGTWSIASGEPVRDVQLNGNLAILAEPKKVGRLPQR